MIIRHYKRLSYIQSHAKLATFFLIAKEFCNYL